MKLDLESMTGLEATVKKLISAGLALACAVLVLGHPTDAAAQATRTWVSGVGDDANPCSRTAPCKTFAGAISKTAAGGYIDVLDPGGYGAVTITKSITLRGVGEEGSILVSGTGAVVINAAATDLVNLIDLQIDGSGTGTTGVRVIQAAQVTILNCNISGFRGSPGTGISSEAGTQSRTSVRNSAIFNNTIGLNIAPSNNALNTVLLDNALVDANPTNIQANGTAAFAVLRRSTVLSGLITSTNGATIRSFGDNAINNGMPTQTTPLQ